MALLANNSLYRNSRLRRYPKSPRDWADWIQLLNQQSVKNLTADTGTIGGWTLSDSTLSSGNVTIDATNELITMGSASAPLTGTGIYIGLDGSSDYDFRAGDPSGDFIHWDGSAGTLSVTGEFSFGSGVTGSFTPTWTGFSTDPTGDIAYVVLGNIVFMYLDGSGVGTSNTTSFSLTGVPAAIRPAGNRMVPCTVIDNSTNKMGAAEVTTSGGITGRMQIVVSSEVLPATSAWTASNSKGWGLGWIISYPL